MFFSTELLSRRDSGYALLWLAATVGSKLKKFPRRDVVSADINQLSQLIAQPPEPLALRLSSNLMVGLVRVYKMKHEIFETDVSACVTSLKKSFHELRAADNHNIEMAKPHLSGDALNAPEDPVMVMALEFDMAEDWDMVFRRIEEVGDSTHELDVDVSFFGQDSSFNALNPSQKRKKLHQLDESYDHLLSSSLLKSLGDDLSIAGNNVSSSINANDLFFDFDFGDGDVGLGEEMERDLAEAWSLRLDDEPEIPKIGINSNLELNSTAYNGAELSEEHNDLNFCNDAMHDANIQFQLEHEDAYGYQTPEPTQISQLTTTARCDPPHMPAFALQDLITTSAGEPVRGIMKVSKDGVNLGNLIDELSSKKRKKVRPIFDPRIELTDEELKFQRYNYPQEMARLRGEAKKKEGTRDDKHRFEEQLWAPPTYFAAPELVEFWNHRVAYPVKSREAAWRREFENDVQCRPKRRRVERAQENRAKETGLPIDQENAFFDFEMERPENNIPDFEENGQMDDPPTFNVVNSGDRHFSDELGRARHSSGPPSLPSSSILFRKGIDISQGELGSNHLFPWDNAGPSLSSITSMPGSANRSELGLSFDKTMVRFRRPSSKSGSQSGRESSAISLLGGQVDGEFVDNDVILFPEVATNAQGGVGETQETDNMVTLEKNSFNFLEYVKMHQASNLGPLFFSDIVPVETSSSRIAAEGFYHCLALATKDLIRLEQNVSYGPIQLELR